MSIKVCEGSPVDISKQYTVEEFITQNILNILIMIVQCALLKCYAIIL